VTLAVFAVALAIRVPNLMLVPRFEDEGIDVLWAFDIANGQRLPLTGLDAYCGYAASRRARTVVSGDDPAAAAVRVVAVGTAALRSPRYAWEWLRWHAGRARRHERSSS
jgi:hypothetical protein